ncbi:MAG: hypothetical protein AAGI01_06895 [Myxococcota bacterium]
MLESYTHQSIEGGAPGGTETKINAGPGASGLTRTDAGAHLWWVTPHGLDTSPEQFSAILLRAWSSLGTSMLLDVEEHVCVVVRDPGGTLFLMRDAFGFLPIFYAHARRDVASVV